VSKFTIEIPDDEVDVFVNDLRDGLSGRRANGIADQLEDQAPGLPVPTKALSVVRTKDGIAILADPKAFHLPWLTANYLSNPTPYEWSQKPGKVLEVIYEGDEG
jgi:hypothetical protein